MAYRVYSQVTEYGYGRRLAILREERDRIEVLQASFKVIDPSLEATEEDWTFSGANLSSRGADDILQAMLDHAWELGMRPKGFADTTKQVEAMQHHLQDMRALVFKDRGVAPEGGEAISTRQA